MTTTALLVIDDGREDYLDRGLASACAALPVETMQLLVVRDADHRLGFAGAIAEGWRRALATGADYIVHVESDFTFNRSVPLGAIIATLEAHPHLVQMALLRQPWNEAERAAGGIVQLHPEHYQLQEDLGHTWLEHRGFVTTNPGVWPRWVCERGWPQCPESEGHFGIALFASDPGLRAAFWGRGEEWVEHVGEVRTGVGY